MKPKDLDRLLELARPVDASPPGPECPSGDALWAFAAGELPAASREAIQSHLARCSGCAAQVARCCHGITRLRKRAPRLRRRIAAAVSPRRSRWPAPLILRQRWLPAAGLAVAAAVGLAVFLLRAPRPESMEALYVKILQESQQGNLEVARARLNEDVAWLALSGGPVTRGDSPGEGARGTPDGAAFLPDDVIEFRGVKVPGGTHRYTLYVDREPLKRDLTEPQCRPPVPPGDWPIGHRRWHMLTQEGDDAGGGEFTVLGPGGQELAARAKRELGREPARLAAAYYVMGLEARAEDLVARLPTGERERFRRRFHLPGAGARP